MFCEPALANTAVDITPQVDAAHQLIKSYGDGGFRIGGRRYEGSVLVLADRVVPIVLRRIADLTRQIIDEFEGDDAPQILLVGCGSSIGLVPDDVRAGLRKRGIVVEPMDTGAACRTYNVLLTEDRRAAALLIATE